MLLQVDHDPHGDHKPPSGQQLAGAGVGTVVEFAQTICPFTLLAEYPVAHEARG